LSDLAYTDVRARPLVRVLEPECMDDDQEARDYDQIDNAAVNAAFADDLLAFAPDAGRCFDMGTGTALIPIELCRRRPMMEVVAIDMSDAMLRIAARNVAAAGLGDRVALENRDGKHTGLAAAAFDVATSNSIIHHIPTPADAFAEMVRLVRPGGAIFVRDLMRPSSDARVRELVARHAAPPPDARGDRLAMYERQRTLFDASLRAALTVDEVRAIVRPLGVPATAVAATSDRHWTLRHHVV
jgi:ubiquinone/menaquinone biosynthesis C-methylase UbiE